jgi:parallel beta-helix repeat protein
MPEELVPEADGNVEQTGTVVPGESAKYTIPQTRPDNQPFFQKTDRYLPLKISEKESIQTSVSQEIIEESSSDFFEKDFINPPLDEADNPASIEEVLNDEEGKSTVNDDRTSNAGSTPPPSTTVTYTKTILLGTDNPEYPGEALGKTRKLGNMCFSTTQQYAYMLHYTTSYFTQDDQHSWAVFDLLDLLQWEGVEVKSAKLTMHNSMTRDFKIANFTVLETVPYNNAPMNTAWKIFNESGPEGLQVGNYFTNTPSNYSIKPFEVNLNSKAVNAMNEKLTNSSSGKELGIGMFIYNPYGGVKYSFARWFDIRLEVTFDYTKDLINTLPNSGIAIAGDLTATTRKSGYGSPTTYPAGSSIIELNNYYDTRTYINWDSGKLKSLILPANGSNIHITKVSLRVNHEYSPMHEVYVNQMKNDVTSSSATTIFDDCGDGPLYYGPATLIEFENSECDWNLGYRAVKDLEEAIYNSSINNFAVGLRTLAFTTRSLDYGFKLVVEWADHLPVYNIDRDEYYPTIQIGVDEAKPGDSLIAEDRIYYESVTILKAVKLKGESGDKTILDSTTAEQAVLISAENVQLNDLTIRGTDSPDYASGIKFENAVNSAAVNIALPDHSIGIHLDQSENINLAGNTMTDSGLYVTGELIQHWNSHSISTDNTVNGRPNVYLKDADAPAVPANAGQIILANCQNTVLSNQNLDGISNGLITGFSNNIQISYLTAKSNSMSGVIIAHSSAITISSCEMNENGQNGLMVFNSTDNSILYNTLMNNGENGIYLKSSSNNKIQDNFCENNTNGILIESGKNNLITNNELFNNTESGIINMIGSVKNSKKDPLDIVLALDTSGSMSGQKLLDLKTAAKNFINHNFVNNQDRIAIYQFLNGRPTMTQPYTVCDSYGKQLLSAKVNYLFAVGGTPIWDMIGDAITYSITNSSERRQVVIAMTDGGDTVSTRFAPWGEWNGSKGHYHEVDGQKYHDHFDFTGSTPEKENQWYWRNDNPSVEWRYGLLNKSDITVFTVGLGLVHRDHSNGSSWRFPEGWIGAYAQYESEKNNWVVNRNSSIYDESGTPEFNLWRIANTSGGKYFYADTPDKLNPIFQELVILLKQPVIDINSTITGNDIAGNKRGIDLKISSNITMTENRIYNNTIGINLETSSNFNLVYRNSIRNNTNGLLISSSEDNIVYNNNFIDNVIHADADESNTWNVSKPEGGNYWDTWTTPDNDNDGFVDIPFDVSEELNSDLLPLTEPLDLTQKPGAGPEVDLFIEKTDAVVSIRIAGEKWHDVVIELYEDGAMIANGTLVRYPGSPNDQTLKLTTFTINSASTYSAVVRYTPEDDPVNGQPNGANPCWIILDYSSNKTVKLKHTFNVNHKDTYIWNAELTDELHSNGFTITAVVYDPGAAALSLQWIIDGVKISTINITNPDFSEPMKVSDIFSCGFTESGTHVITVIVQNDTGQKTEKTSTLDIT